MSYDPFTLVLRDFTALLAVEETGDGVRVTTHCMYPSNGLVRVTLRAGRETVVASDEGEAVGEALSAGIALRNPDRILRSIVRQQGLDIHGGVISTPRMPIEAAPLAILLVANTAKEAAQWLYDHQKLKRDRDFRRLLAHFLKKTFADRVAPTTIIGASNKPHKFVHVISLPDERKLIVDPVQNDPSSINARVVANLDVKSPKLVQRIIFDDQEDWSAADLNLLSVGAPAIPFSQSPSTIQRVASG
jgi:hypothetical protein